MELHHHGGKFAISIVEEKPQQHRATVTISHEYIDALYDEVVRGQKNQVLTFGFQKGTTPLQYIEQNFGSDLMIHIQELLFTHCVIQFLYSSFHERKIVVVGDPELLTIQIHPHTDGEFVFLVHSVALLPDARWKKIAVKTHQRKLYKDLDRQVEAFLEEEMTEKKDHSPDTIGFGDWVLFSLALHTVDKAPLMKDHVNNLWVHVSAEEDDSALHQLFLGRKPGESFFTDSAYLQHYLSPSHHMDYRYHVSIHSFVSAGRFSLPLFKHQFLIKDDEEAISKLIEVFSYRNDLSLRREIIEAVLKQLTKQYFFQIPGSVLDEQCELVHAAVQENPDYHVYKSSADFQEHIKQLATKQLKEAILMDSIAYHEKISVSLDDIHSYLHLTFRPRTREFVYFRVPVPRTLGQEVPIPAEIVTQYCLREKTLNHIIQTLSKKVRA